MPAPTHYQVLGIEPTATAAQVRRAYREKARSHHPDVSKAADAAERFAEIARAYEVLSDRTLRAEYDARLAAPDRPRGKRDRTSPRYTWTNIATEQSRASESASADFDEMYDAYFGSHRPAE